jgi:hypothetical protein
VKQFFRIVVIYVVVSFAITALMRDLTLDLFVQAGVATYQFGTVILKASTRLLPIFLVVPFIIGWRSFVTNIHLVIYAVLGSIFLQLGFTFFKSTIPMIVPFYADPWFASFDQWLHGGYDPWELVHQLDQYLPLARLLPVYLWIWTVPAVALILFIAITDRDQARTTRFIVLYLSCWLILGNVFALAGASVGPIYYDALLGGDRFAGLHAALASSGLADTAIGRIQHYLWVAYAERNVALGSGISAFPSVHVGIATITALYLAERSRWLAVPGFAFLAVILLLSVYTGYHYAIDGYFSLLFIFGLWVALRRLQTSDLGLPWAGLRPAVSCAEAGASIR